MVPLFKIQEPIYKWNAHRALWNRPRSTFQIARNQVKIADAKEAYLNQLPHSG